MLLEQEHSLLHRLNLVVGSLLDHLDVTEVSHDSHEEVLLRLHVDLGLVGQDLDSIADHLDEVVDVVDLPDGVVQQELSVGVDPVLDDALQLLDQRSSVDLEPSDLNSGSHLVDLISDAVQESDLLVELIETWLLGGDAVEDSLGHPSEGWVLLFLVVGILPHVLHLSWVRAGLEESSEGLRELLLPEELLLLVGGDESVGCLDNVREVLLNGLHSSVDDELVLHLHEVVASSIRS